MVCKIIWGVSYGPIVPIFIWGGSINGATPKASWFQNPNLKWPITRGTSIYGNLQLDGVSFFFGHRKSQMIGMTSSLIDHIASFIDYPVTTESSIVSMYPRVSEHKFSSPTSSTI